MIISLKPSLLLLSAYTIFITNAEVGRAIKSDETKIATESRFKRCSCMWKRSTSIEKMPIRSKRENNCMCPWDNNNNNDNSAGSGLGLNLNGLTSLLELRTLLGLGGLGGLGGGAAAAAPPAAAPPVIVLGGQSALGGYPVVDPVTGRVAILGTGRESSLSAALGKREEPTAAQAQLNAARNQINETSPDEEKRLPNGGIFTRVGNNRAGGDLRTVGNLLDRYTAGTDYGRIDNHLPVDGHTNTSTLDAPCDGSEECSAGEECRWSPVVGGGSRTCQCTAPLQRKGDKCIQWHVTNPNMNSIYYKK